MGSAFSPPVFPFFSPSHSLTLVLSLSLTLSLSLSPSFSPLLSLHLRVSSITHQLAHLDSESWCGRAEVDRYSLQLLREKEALLQEITLLSQQQRPPEAFLQLEEARRRLEEEVQRARRLES